MLGPVPAVGSGPMPSPQDWYGDLLWSSRYKCLLLTHAGTLFSIFEADVRAAGLRGTYRTVAGVIARELARENLPADTFGLVSTGELVVAKTADRSVLGCMNDMAGLCEQVISRSGGLQHTDSTELNHALRRNINSARGYQRPVDPAAARMRDAH